MNILFSIIFVNYQSAEKLQRALESLRIPLRNIPHEIIVVNNDLKEREAIDSLQLQYQFKIKHLSANFGFAKANNVGAKCSLGKILLFLNPDTVWKSGSFLSFAACLEGQGEAILGVRICSLNEKDEPWSCGNLPSLAELFFRKGKRIIGNVPWKRGVFSEVGWVSGAGLALYRETYQKLGGFDEAYFLYYEDVDLSARAKKQNIRTFRFPFLEFFHNRGQSHDSLLAMKRAYFTGQKLYFSKHRTKKEQKMLNFFHWVFFRRFL